VGFLFAGQAERGISLGEGMADGGEEKDGQADQEDDAGQRFRGLI